MMKLLGRKRSIAIMMVVIMVFTLLPVDLNWADDASMIQDRESTEVTTEISSELLSSEEYTATEEITTESIVTEEMSTENVFEDSSAEDVNTTTTEVVEKEIVDSSTETITEESPVVEHTIPTESETKWIPVQEEVSEKQTADSNTKTDIFDNTTIDLGSLQLEASYKDADNKTQVVDMTTTDNVELPADANIYMKYNFVMGNGNSVDCSKSYTYKIPDGIRVDANDTHELEDANGESIGKVVISSNGTMTFTFYEDKIKNQQSIPFFVEFYGGFSSEVQENKGETELNFPTASGEFTYNVDVTDSYQEDEDKEPGNISTYKNGTKLVSDADGNTYIQWSIGIDPNGRDVYSAQVVDNLPAGLTYVPGSEKLSGESWGSTASVKATTEGQRVTFQITDSDPDYHTSLTFLTAYDESIFGSGPITNDTKTIINNTVAVNPDDNTDSAEDSAEVEIKPDVLSKSGATYNSETGTIKWTVTINSDGFELGDAIYTDTFSEGLTYKANSVKMIPDGAGTFTTTADGFTFDPADGFTSDKIVLTYETTVENTHLQDAQFTNTGVLTGTDYNYFTSAKVDGVDWISKTATAYNDVTKQFTWSIVVNSDNLTLTDVVVEESFNATDMKLVSATVTGSNGVTTPAVLEGNNIKLGDINEKKTITVVTQLLEDTFVTPDWTGSDTLVEGIWYTAYNTAILKTGGKEISATAQKDFEYKKPDLLAKNGSITDDGTILWSLNVKYQNVKQDKIVITDTLPADMEYVPGSFRLQYYDQIWDASTQQVYVEPTVANGVLTYTLEQDTLADSFYMNNSFYVLYETKLKDENIEQAKTSGTYTNDAQIEVTYEGDVKVTDEATKTVEGTIGGILGKEYAYSSSNDYVDWTVVINEAGYDMSDIDNPIIKDKLEDYFDYVSGTLYKTTNGVREEVSASDYVVVVVNNVITVKLPNIGKDTYEFVFRTKFNISAAKLESMTIKNTVDFVGEGLTQSSTSDEVKNVSFSSSSAGSRIEKELRIRKVDSVTKEPLTGAEFVLYYQGVECDTLTTDEDGWAVFSVTSALDGYTYELVETQAPDGYKEKTGSEQITINDAALKTDTSTGVRYLEYEITNDKITTTATINLYKTDDNNSPLPGAEFGLYSDAACETLVMKRTTDTKGMAVFSVECGENNTTYYLKEINAPDGYIVSDDIKEVTVASDGVVTYVDGSVTVNEKKAASFENKKAKATLVLKKTEEDSNPEVLIDGAKFGLYADASCNDLIEEAVTGATGTEGTITFTTALELGKTYYYRELEAPTGYVLDSTIYSVTIGDGTEHENLTQTVTVTNEKALGAIRITKTDDNIPANTMSGVGFTLYDNEGNPIQRDGADYTVTTDSTGLAVFDQLEFGTYVVKEDGAPEGYVAATDTTVVLDSVDGTDVTIVNKQIKIKVKITKTDDANNTLEGVTFGIYKKSTGALVKSGTTNANGEITFTDIPYGDYEVRETKGLDGYVMDTSVKTITADGNMTMNAEYAFEFENKKENGTIQFKKRATDLNADSSINYLAGAEFTIYDSKGRAVTTATSNSSGVITFTNLPYDIYTIKETKAPVDATDPNKPIYYKLDNTEWTVEVTDNITYTELYSVLDGVTLEEISNDKLDEGIIYVSFKVEKTDSEGNALKGAQFEFSKKNPGDEEWTLLSTAYSDDAGIVEFYNISIEGDDATKPTYRVQEVAAPTGYQLDEENCTKEYTYDELVYMQVAGYDDVVGHPVEKIVFTNVPLIESFENDKILASIRVTKTGLMSSQKLQGAEFTLYQKDGVTPYKVDGEPYTVVTDKNGIAMFDDLPVGDYVVRETGAPKGYTLNTLYRPSVTIVDTTTKDVTFTNTPIHVYVSKQAVGGTQLIAGAVLAIYDGNTELERWTTTTEKHELIASNLETSKTYTLKELKAPNGYIVAQEVEFMIQDDGTVTYISGDGSANGRDVTMVDDLLSLTIRKVDAATGSDLSGALLTVIDDATGTSIYDFTSAGNIVNVPSDKLVAPSKAGEYTYYTIREKSAPSGYQLAEDIQIAIGYDGTLYLVDGANMTVTSNPIVMEDEEKHDFYFAKVDATTGQRLAGASLSITDANGMTVATWTSSTTPKQVIGLTAGSTYVFKEIEEPTGYIKAKSITFKVSDDGSKLSILDGSASDLSYDQVTITMKDERINVKMRKLTEDSIILPGATFELHQSNEDKEQGALLETFTTTDGSTVLNYKNLKTEAWYVLVETDAPQGYEIAEPVYFYIDEKGVVYNEFGEQIDSNLIEIKDIEKQLSIQKVDADTDEALEGVTLCITSVEDNDFTTVEWVTDGTAKYFDYSDFKYDTKYVLTETQTLNGYTYAESIEFYINAADEVVYADETAMKGNRITMKNTTFEVSVDKLDLDTKKPLEGATLAVKNADGEILEQWVTDGKPHQLDTSKLHVSLNDENVYTLEELEAPELYALAQPIQFILNQKGELQRVDGEAVENNTIVIYDEYIGVKFNKTDENGEELPDATITITSLEDTDFEPITFVTTNVPKNLSMDMFKRNVNYIMTEVVAPNGYTYASDVVFRIDDDGVVYVNDVATDDNTVTMIDTQFNLSVAKKEKGSDKLITGAKLSIVEEESGTVICSWKTNGKVKSIATDKLKASTDEERVVYILKETKAPKGYELAKDIRFFIDKDGQVCILKENKVVKATDNVLTMYDKKVDVDTEKTTEEEPDENVSTTSKKTGDDSPLDILFGIFLFALLGFGITLGYKKKLEE